MSDMWTTVAAERGALADDLAGLSAEQWQTRSLCGDWSVREVLAHLTSAATLNPVTFLARFAASGFRFDRFANGGVQRELGADPAETLSRFRAVQHSTSAPPGPKLTWLGEVLVHSQDIRRPLGIAHTYAPDAARQVADFYKGSDTLIGSKTRIAGLGLRATDTDWSHGSGPAVEGPVMSLVMAMTGRVAACDDLSGEGVATLRSRCPS
jgi:uncharacterized protein (TIGR03083 family)